MPDNNPVQTAVKKPSWFAGHKGLTIVLVVVLIIIIAVGASSNKNSGRSSNSNSSAAPTSNVKTYRFNDRLDKQKTDIEVVPGEMATIDGVKMAVTSADYKQSLDEFTTAESGKTYLVINVALENTDTTTHSYNEFDFRIQTVSGQVLDPDVSSATSPLNSGDIVAGGKVSGSVVFLVPQEKGDQYVIWKPNPLKSDRAIVQVKQQ